MLNRTVNAILKMISIIIMFFIIFFIFGRAYPALRNLSRTAVITIGVFMISFAYFNSVFGSFQFGKFKRKPIIYTTTLTVIFTDIIFFVFLMIMNTNPNNPAANSIFRFENIDLLFISALFQYIFIYVLSLVGNELYFKIIKPQSTIIITNKTDNNKLLKFIERFKKQYRIIDVVDFESFFRKEVGSNIDFAIIDEYNSTERNLIINILYSKGISYSFTSSIIDVINLTGKNEIYDDIPMVEVNLNSSNFFDKAVKRLMDISISLTILVITFPLWIVFSILIKLEDKGKIFFLQSRKTLNGTDFNVIKFRTMKENSANYSAVANDDRITKVGAILRKIRLDELPQFLNIIKGDMSIVGPRPEMVENILLYEQELPEFNYRLKMKAGLTGLAQIEGKYNTSAKDKLVMDITYIQNFSIWNDIRLIFRTVIVFFKKDSVEGF